MLPNNLKYIFIIVIVTWVMLIIPGCDTPISGSGNVTSKSYDLKSFTKLEISNGMQVKIEQSPTYGVVVTADDNIFEYIEVRKPADTLIIIPRRGCGPNCAIRPSLLFAKVSMPDLDIIKLASGAQAEIADFNLSHDLSIVLSGGSVLTTADKSGKVTAKTVSITLDSQNIVNLSGSAEKLIIDSLSFGSLNLDDFKVNDADLAIGEFTQAEVNVTGILNANLSRGAKVCYYGNPTIGEVNLSKDSELKQCD